MTAKPPENQILIPDAFLFILLAAARPLTLSEIITVAVVAAVVVVAALGGLIACVVRARSHHSAEALQPLLGETFRSYSEDDRRLDKSQSVV